MVSVPETPQLGWAMVNVGNAGTTGVALTEPEVVVAEVHNEVASLAITVCVPDVTSNVPDANVA